MQLHRGAATDSGLSKRHTAEEALKIYEYHGPKRCLPTSGELPYDIVFSTYGTVSADFGRGGGVLDHFQWYRIVLDEGEFFPSFKRRSGGQMMKCLSLKPHQQPAHIIRNNSTKLFKAVMSLSGSIRWCITGTPIQNGLEDLGSLVQYIQVPHLQDPPTFRKHIIGKRYEHGKSGEHTIPKPNVRNLKLLLNSICLRRTISILKLPSISTLEHRPSLSLTERRVYDSLGHVLLRNIDAVVSGGQFSKNEGKNILEGLLRLRIFCNTGLSSRARTRGRLLLEPGELVSLFQQSGKVDCVKCHADFIKFKGEEDPETPRLTLCYRLICSRCYGDEVSFSSHGVSCRLRVALLAPRSVQIPSRPAPMKAVLYLSATQNRIRNVRRQQSLFGF
jgi:SNF2 family DNA or RNA helicase